MDTRDYHEIKGLLVEIRNKVTELVKNRQKELLTSAEVCKWLKIGRSTYQRYVDRGLFAQVRVGGKVYVQRGDIHQLIVEGKL